MGVGQRVRIRTAMAAAGLTGIPRERASMPRRGLTSPHADCSDLGPAESWPSSLRELAATTEARKGPFSEEQGADACNDKASGRGGLQLVRSLVSWETTPEVAPRQRRAREQRQARHPLFGQDHE